LKKKVIVGFFGECTSFPKRNICFWFWIHLECN